MMTKLNDMFPHIHYFTKSACSNVYMHEKFTPIKCLDNCICINKESQNMYDIAVQLHFV